MLKKEVLLIKILEKCFKEKATRFTQKELSKEASIGLVNSLVKELKGLGIVKVYKRHFEVIDLKKLLIYTCVQRNFYKDIIDSFHVEASIKEIESSMPPKVTYTSYSAYRLLFNEAPSDYSEIYVYSNENLRKRFKINDKKRPNLFVLKKDFNMTNIAPMPLIYIDLWNLKEWYAKEFLKSFEERLKNEGILE